MKLVLQRNGLFYFPHRGQRSFFEGSVPSSKDAVDITWYSATLLFLLLKKTVALSEVFCFEGTCIFPRNVAIKNNRRQECCTWTHNAYWRGRVYFFGEGFSPNKESSSARKFCNHQLTSEVAFFDGTGCHIFEKQTVLLWRFWFFHRIACWECGSFSNTCSSTVNWNIASKGWQSTKGSSSGATLSFTSRSKGRVASPVAWLFRRLYILGLQPDPPPAPHEP